MDVEVKWKKLHPLANVTQAHEGDAGFDLVACNVITHICEPSAPYDKVEYSLGMAVEIPPGYVGMIFPRSSVHKTHQSLANCVGIIDSSYRGELKAIFYTNSLTACYKPGERCCQMIIMPYPKVKYSLVEQFDNEETVRGTGGFGSSGK